MVKVVLTGRRERKSLLDAVESRMDKQGKGEIGIAGRVGGTQLNPGIFACDGGNSDELRAVGVGPRNDVLRPYDNFFLA